MLVRSIGSAMDEAVDQQSVVVYPLPSDAEPVVTRAHEDLAKQHGSGTILTIPLGNREEFFGGLTLERPAEKVFDKKTIELCETVAAVQWNGPLYALLFSRVHASSAHDFPWYHHTP